jgi:hypothetical protein
MDPTANLAMQRALADLILKTADRRTSPRGVEFEQQCIELAEHVQALDDWLSERRLERRLPADAVALALRPRREREGS